MLLGRHDDEGALGWVINGQELAPVDELLRASELFPAETTFPSGPGFQLLARVGGPVAPATGWLVYRRLAEALPGELALGPDLAVTGEASAFSALVEAGGPADFRLVLGCAGWAPGQLEAEISGGAWLPAGAGGGPAVRRHQRRHLGRGLPAGHRRGARGVQQQAGKGVGEGVGGSGAGGRRRRQR